MTTDAEYFVRPLASDSTRFQRVPNEPQYAGPTSTHIRAGAVQRLWHFVLLFLTSPTLKAYSNALIEEQRDGLF
jgi:hypothetical protein